ncbi:hypothetical protein L227DRAFT_297789 [Lentinus tigrinus ALCF2SS1-6]|uniref:Uncharacterized protein n=1 Tax=Lentinus tigrinus ALCF2SS1-6 TaxID=1328759 RepID=A0A5C2RX28_9APHY|nr:hypothetical protein L227DRAFT_297789 [Lentinus tigrinus ALCF2SS1-6]
MSTSQSSTRASELPFRAHRMLSAHPSLTVLLVFQLRTAHDFLESRRSYGRRACISTTSFSLLIVRACCLSLEFRRGSGSGLLDSRAAGLTCRHPHVRNGRMDATSS